MQIACAGVTDVGRVRTNNEDCFRIVKPLNLYVLADGMGGEAHGEAPPGARAGSGSFGIALMSKAQGMAERQKPCDFGTSCARCATAPSLRLTNVGFSRRDE